MRGERRRGRQRDGDDAPWILTFDNFLSDEEIETLIASVSDWALDRHGRVQRDDGGPQAERRADVAERMVPRRDVRGAAAVGRVLARIEEFVRIPRSNFENFQAPYGVGERCAAPDFGASQRRLAPGPRILTFFYTYPTSTRAAGRSRAFEEDGVALAVRPRRGSALWPPVRDGAMDRDRARTHHEARRVVRGTKPAANAWIHARLQDPAPLGVHRRIRRVQITRMRRGRRAVRVLSAGF